MAQVLWSAEALRALDAINAYISEVSGELAAAVVERLRVAAQPLARFPRMGRMIPCVERDFLRELIVEQYRLIYELSADTVTIVTILHSAQDIRRTASPTVAGAEMKIALIGQAAFGEAVFRALREAREDIVAVSSITGTPERPDALWAAAEAAGIPLFPTGELKQRDVLDTYAATKPDLGVMAFVTHILPPRVSTCRLAAHGTARSDRSVELEPYVRHEYAHEGQHLAQLRTAPGGHSDGG